MNVNNSMVQDLSIFLPPNYILSHHSLISEPIFQQIMCNFGLLIASSSLLLFQSIVFQEVQLQSFLTLVYSVA